MIVLLDTLKSIEIVDITSTRSRVYCRNVDTDHLVRQGDLSDSINIYVVGGRSIDQAAWITLLNMMNNVDIAAAYTLLQLSTHI